MGGGSGHGWVSQAIAIRYLRPKFKMGFWGFLATKKENLMLSLFIIIKEQRRIISTKKKKKNRDVWLFALERI